MVRLFVSPSHLCTLYMILYARKTRKEGYKDILVLDSPPKKRALINLITDTKNIYNWDAVIDLSSPLPDDVELLPNTRKQLTRKLKDKAFIKPIYNLLLKNHLKKKRLFESKVISEKLRGLGEVIEINILTQTLINDTLFELFPKAAVNYFEHGIGEYFWVQKVKNKNFNFYCVFADEFKKFLEEKKQNAAYVKKLVDVESFPSIAKEVIDKSEYRTETTSLVKTDGKIVLILLEAMQLYQVRDAYYTDYIDLCVKQVKNPHDYTFVLKPHPAQTQKSIEDSKNRLTDHYKVKTLVIEGGHFMNFSVEVLYTLWKERVGYFFAAFSSAVFYNSVLYKNGNTSYFYSYELFLNYLENAPAGFVDVYRGSEEPIKKVFSANCTSMT